MLEKRHIRSIRNMRKTAGWESAIIAGGAVRDAFFKQQPKDVDIFIHNPIPPDQIDFDPIQLVELITSMGLVQYDELWSLVPNGSEYSGHKIDYVISVWTLEKDYDTYQLIFTQIPPIEYVTKYFDIGLCMCYFDGTLIRYTHDFLMDQKNKTITICGDLSKHEFLKTLYDHVIRIKSKFPSFRVQVASHLDRYLTTNLRTYIKNL